MAAQPPVIAPPASESEPPPEPNPRTEDGKVLTILEHLGELRYRLMVCAGALAVGLALSIYPLTGWTVEFLQEPAKDRVENFNLVFTEPLEGWTTFFRVSLLLAVAMAMPVIIYQLLAFVSPGLTGNEKKWVFPLVLGASIMFVGGCAFAYYVELPPAIGFLLEPPGAVGEPFIRSSKYFDFVTRLMFITGVVFELPLVVMGFAKLGVVTSSKLFGWWRQAIIVSVVVAAIVTPSIDPMTQLLVAGPIVVLYFAGALLAKLVENNPIIPKL